MSHYNDATHKSSDEPAHNYDAGAGAESQSLPDVDTVYDLLRDERRRNLIRRLSHIDSADGIEGVTIQEASRAIAADENGGDVPDDPLVREVATTLEHVHAPKLADTGILRRDGDVLSPGPHLPIARAAMNAVELTMEPSGAVVRRGEGE